MPATNVIARAKVCDDTKAVYEQAVTTYRPDSDVRYRHEPLPVCLALAVCPSSVDRVPARKLTPTNSLSSRSWP